MNYTELLEQKVAELMAKVKCIAKNKYSLSSEELLPNHRVAERCCANCLFFDADYEGVGYCRILNALREKLDDSMFISSCVSAVDLCDYWVEQK